MATQLPTHKNKWENALQVDGYFAVGVIAISHPEFGCIITKVSKEERTYPQLGVDCLGLEDTLEGSLTLIWYFSLETPIINQCRVVLKKQCVVSKKRALYVTTNGNYVWE